MRPEERQKENQEIISMEEYLNKRQKLKEKQKEKEGKYEKSPAWMWTELYV